MEKKLVMFLLVGIFLISFISSAPPVTTVQQFAQSYEIEDSPQTILQQNKDFQINFFVYNLSDHRLITDSDIDCCTYFLSNSSGNVLFAENATYDPDGHWYLTVKGGNFSNVGHYFYGIRCDGAFDGSTTGDYDVTYSGTLIDEGEALLYIPLFLVMFFLFFATVYGIGMLPDSNATDPEERIVKISYLKYLRSSLWFVLWMMLVGLFFVSSNVAYAYLPDTMMAEIFLMLYKISFALTLPVVVAWLIWIFAQIIDDNKIKSMWNRGMFPQKI